MLMLVGALPALCAPAEPSGVVDVAVGEVRVLELPSNPSTGFQWELVAPQRSAVLAVELSFEAPPLPPEGEELLCGAPGVMRVRLHGLQPGTELLRLLYRRCWETDAPPAEQRVLQVRVRE
ncbi:MAG: protease inhibitor I42 family protein [Akkermansia sp.]